MVDWKCGTEGLLGMFNFSFFLQNTKACQKKYEEYTFFKRMIHRSQFHTGKYTPGERSILVTAVISS
jgi:hypothetical protein